MLKGLIIYETKYGSTKESAFLISKTLLHCEVVSIDNISLGQLNVDYIILGTHMYKGQIAPKLLAFITSNLNLFKGKKIFSYVMNLEGDIGEKYLKPLKLLFKDQLILMQAIPGKVDIEKLTPKDYDDLKEMFTQVGLPMKSINLFRPETVEVFAQDILTQLTQKEGDIMVSLDIMIQRPHVCVIMFQLNGQPFIMRRRFVYFEKKLYFLFEKGVAPIITDELPVELLIFTLVEKPEAEIEARITSTFKKVDPKTDEYRFVMHENGLEALWIEAHPDMLEMFKVTLEHVQYSVI
ncbi:MAG TPA: hypothetical protein DCY20_09485 [Firmicutes bacterium]|nr:hypothetical protein [Bacillota bacterium]